MSIKKVIEIDVEIVKAQGGLDNFTKNIQKSEEATKSLKAQMLEAQKAVNDLSEKFGATSREAVEAAKNAAILKDKIGDAKSLTAAFNPDAKFKALSGALVGVAGGFSVMTGAMGILGIESKSTQEALLKVQSAMAIASGAQAVGESIDSFKQLGAVVKSYSVVQKVSTYAQYLWNAAQAANPLGAILAVIVAVIAAGYALAKMFIASSESTKAATNANIKLNSELDNQVNSHKKLTQQNDLSRESQIGMAKASGASSEAIRKLTSELSRQEVQEKFLNATKLRSIAIEAQRVAGLDDATEAQKETAKKAMEAFTDANKNYSESLLNRKKLLINNRIEIQQEETNAAKKSNEESNKAAEELRAKIKENKKKLLDDAKSINEEAIVNNNKISQTNIEIENESYNKKLKLLKAQKVSTEALEIEHLNKINDINVENANKKSEANAKTKADDDAKSKLKKEKEANEFLRLQELTLTEYEYNKLVLKQKYEAEVLAAKDNLELIAALKKKYKEDVITEEEKEKERKAILRKQELQAAADTFGLLSEMSGKASKTGKAFAIAQALINTYLGISAGVKLGYPLAIPAVIQAAVTGFKAVKDIQATNPSASGGGGSAPSGGGGGSSSAVPSFNIVGQSSTNQLSATIANQQNKPVKAYVVSGEVSTQQGLDRNAAATSTFG
jgi:hypothetical protein